MCVCVNDRGGKRLGLSEKRTSLMYVVLMGPKSFATVAPRDKRHNWGSLCAFVFDYMSVCTCPRNKLSITLYIHVAHFKKLKLFKLHIWTWSGVTM